MRKKYRKRILGRAGGGNKSWNMRMRMSLQLKCQTEIRCPQGRVKSALEIFFTHPKLHPRLCPFIIFLLHLRYSNEVKNKILVKTNLTFDRGSNRMAFTHFVYIKAQYMRFSICVTFVKASVVVRSKLRSNFIREENASISPPKMLWVYVDPF